MVCSNLSRFISGEITRRTLLCVVFPLIIVSYFGMLALAIVLYPGGYDWRFMSVSKLLYPRNNPQFYSIASIGIVVTGLLMIPFAGYINRRLRSAAPVIANVATVAFAGGVVCTILAGLVSSHPLHGSSSLPKLHEILARAAAIGIGIGILVFNVCAVKAYCNPATEKNPVRRSLVVSWNLLTLPAILVVVVKLVMYARIQSLNPMFQALRNSAAWHLGFWEWIGSTAIILFLFCSALLLPEHAGE
jgi:hypothetical protein